MGFSPAAAATAAAISGVEWQRSCRSPVFYETDRIELSVGPIRRRFRSGFGGSVAAATVATIADRDREWPSPLLSVSVLSLVPSAPAFIRACLAAPFPLEKIECSPSSKESLRGKKKQRPKRPISSLRDATGFTREKGFLRSFIFSFFLPR